MDVGGKGSPSPFESWRQFRPGVSLPQGWAAMGSRPKLLTLLESLFAFRDGPLMHGAKENGAVNGPGGCGFLPTPLPSASVWALEQETPASLVPPPTAGLPVHVRKGGPAAQAFG